MYFDDDIQECIQANKAELRKTIRFMQANGYSLNNLRNHLCMIESMAFNELMEEL